MKEAGSFLISQVDQFISEVIALVMPLTHPQEEDLHLKLRKAYEAFVQRQLRNVHKSINPPGSVEEGILDGETPETLQDWRPASNSESTSESPSLQRMCDNGESLEIDTYLQPTIRWNTSDIG
jgi:hypothetical protein